MKRNWGYLVLVLFALVMLFPGVSAASAPHPPGIIIDGIHHVLSAAKDVGHFLLDLLWWIRRGLTHTLGGGW